MPKHASSKRIVEYSGIRERWLSTRLMVYVGSVAASLLPWLMSFVWGMQFHFVLPMGDGAGTYSVSAEMSCGETRIRRYSVNPDPMLSGSSAESLRMRRTGWAWGFVDYPDLSPAMRTRFPGQQPWIGPILGVAIWSEHSMGQTADTGRSVVRLEQWHFGLLVPVWMTAVLLVGAGLLWAFALIRILSYASRTWQMVRAGRSRKM